MVLLCTVAAGLLLGPARAVCDAALLQRKRVTLCINVSRQQPFPPLQPLRCTVKAARPEAEPNAGFWAQLQRYEEDLRLRKLSAEQQT
ncbi:PREDICTED: dual specificity phosphatase 28-like [Tinamus guttatus]|uniref:dual specificity phosphatase 28-like n=1 Tax=Tinamus guttatus TaxID=94827 RepID=UPI00052ECDE9|nr:PREDICTED: dual specificity phosphatase 28-like [Tinamus guttatus]